VSVCFMAHSQFSALSMWPQWRICIRLVFLSTRFFLRPRVYENCFRLGLCKLLKTVHFGWICSSSYTNVHYVNLSTADTVYQQVIRLQSQYPELMGTGQSICLTAALFSHTPKLVVAPFASVGAGVCAIRFCACASDLSSPYVSISLLSQYTFFRMYVCMYVHVRVCRETFYAKAWAYLDDPVHCGLSIFLVDQQCGQIGHFMSWKLSISILT